MQLTPRHASTTRQMFVLLFTAVMAVHCGKDKKDEHQQQQPSPQDAACQQSILEVKSTADLAQLDACKQFTGSIMISSTDMRELHLNNLKDIVGDLIVHNASALTWIDAPNLQSVSGSLRIENGHDFNVLSVPKLTEAQSLVLNNLPSLKSLIFPAGMTHNNHLYITDTGLTKVDGFAENTVDDINVAGNMNLNALDLSLLESVQQGMYISSNGPEFQLDISNIKQVGRATFEATKSIKMDRLERVKGDLYFVDNFMDQLALPNVTEVGGALVIANNTGLQHVAAPLLTKVDGALSVTNNRQLGTVDAFPKLEQVLGSVNLAGAFDDVFLPKLNDVRGGFVIKSSSDKFSCNNINALKQQEVIKGHAFSCQRVDEQQVFSNTPDSASVSIRGNLRLISYTNGLLALFALFWPFLSISIF